jgi:ATP-dependent Clp protease, protease subunit
MKEPIRIFEGDAKPHEPFWRWRDSAETDAADPELEFYGYISEYSWFEDDISPRMFKDDLYAQGKGGPIKLRIHSGGGDTWAASVIRSVIKDYPGKVTVQIDGLCASAAVGVAIAGDRVTMMDSAYMMIHDPWTIAIGNEAEIKRVVDELKVCKDGILDIYAEKTGMPRDKLDRMMENDTWMTAAEAKDYGFVDEVITAPGKKGFPNGSQAVLVNAIRNYSNIPAQLLAQLKAPDEPDLNPAADRLRAEVKLLR